MHHGVVAKEVLCQAIAGIERELDRVAGSEDHGGGIQKADQHAACAHGIDRIVAELGGLYLLLLEVRQYVLQRELTLRNADDLCAVASGRGTEGGEGKLVNVVIFIETR